jgi:hypothetical protein
VLIEGEGGVGKSRLVNEMLQRMGVSVVADEDSDLQTHELWLDIQGKVVATQLIDLSETKLQTQPFFMSTLANSSIWKFPPDSQEIETLYFAEFQGAGREWQRLSDLGIAFEAVKEAAQKAELAFWKDFREITTQKRAVITLDTAEQLLIGSQWLLDAGLLEPDDVLFHTQRWLLNHIRQGKFVNTTLFVVSRTKEGQAFIQALKEAALSTPSCEWQSIPLKPFGLEEVKLYLQALINDLKGSENALHTYLNEVIKDENRLKVLWLYTGGQPIRLALYIDVLLEGLVMPDPLQDSYVEAIQRTRWQQGELETDELLQARQEIEAEFVKSLFNQSESLSSQILQLLVRCPRGLSFEQIHFVLDSGSKAKPNEWIPTQKRLQEINEELKWLRRLIIVKSRHNGRVIDYLQDEMYRIYNECMGRSGVDRQAEETARLWLYQKLRDWAENERQKLLEQRAAQVRDDLKRIRLERPSRVSAIRFPTPTAIEAARLAQLEANLLEAELEYLHYELLLDPQENFNDTYYDLVNRRETAYREDQINVLEAEADRLIRNDHLMVLLKWRSRLSIEMRGETPLQVLRRTAKLDEAIKWIIRFFLRKEYKRAIKLAKALEAYIHIIPDHIERSAWQHSLNRTERACYYQFSRIYSGQNTANAIESLKQMVSATSPLIKLSKMNESEILEETGERGFIGHPAHSRILFVAAIGWNIIGYGLVTLGRFRDAVEAYTTSLRYVRLVPPEFLKGGQAITLANLARALSEIGRGHAIRLCHDGLERRIEIGDFLPIAYSYNTLGLIYNDFKEPQEALEYSAKAIAIARYVKDKRAVGLSMLQVGEALRGLVQVGGLPLDDSVEELYREADNILAQAYEIFREQEERIRWVEASLELGSLYRDRTEYALETGALDWKRLADNAGLYLEQAATIAEQYGWSHLALDAWVSLGYVYYFARETNLIFAKVLPKVNTLVSENSPARLRAGEKPPLSEEHPAYIFKQLDKLHELLGRIAFSNFTQKMIALRQEIPDRVQRQERFKNDKKLQDGLKSAVTHYVLAINYGQLYSPASATLVLTYDRLYNFLKTLNHEEMKAFYRYKAEIEDLYRITEIQFEQPSNMNDFLWASFGEYLDEDDQTVAHPSQQQGQ